MFKNYLKLFFRNLFKNRLYSFINIFGLAIGIAASLLLFLYISNELSYDQFQKNKENIYRLRCDNLNNGAYAERMAVTNGPVARDAKALFPEIEEYVQLNNFYLNGLLSNDKFKFRSKNSFFASESFFKIFSYKLLEGDPSTVLKEINSIALSRSVAKKFFGNQNAIGKFIKYNNTNLFKVTGIFEDAPQNTHLKFDVLVSYKTMTTYFNTFIETGEAWSADESNYTYFQLKPGTDPKKIETALAGLVTQRIGNLLKAKNQDKKFYLMPIEDIHLKSHYDNELEVNGNIQTVIFFSIIAFIILLIAWVNYINLSTVRSFRRYREIGIRIVNGATRNEIRKQFISEAILINFIATLIAFIVVILASRYFTDYTGLQINPAGLKNFKLMAVFILIIFIGAFCSSIYPAYIVSSVNAVDVLKGKTSRKLGAFSFKKILIATQFGISISLLIGTIIVLKQVNFMQNQNLGFNIEQTLIIQRPSIIDSTWSAKTNTFKNEINKLSFTEGICFSRHTPGEQIDYTQGFITQINDIRNPSYLMYNNFIDADFLKLYGLKLLAGRNFIKGNQNFDLIINRRALKTLGYKTAEEAINKQILNEGWKTKHTIVGVIDDFHQQSLKEDYYPMAFMHFPDPDLAFKYSIKLKTNNVKNAIAEIEKKWQVIFPGNLFEYYFLDEKYNSQYKADVQFGRIFLIFSIIAICIACTGLFALTLYTISLRSKELAIRKVIGASVSEIFVILTKDYFILSLIASVFSIPIMYFIMTQWLQNYAAKIQFNFWFFALPVLTLIIVILISILLLVIKSAKANPIKNLRTE